MQESMRFLIVSYTFPPEGGIGGRRWAKLVKCLHRVGHSVEVVAATLPADEISPWGPDVLGINVYRFATRFPEILTRTPKNTLEKIAYRSALARLKRRTKGTPYDRAALDKESILTLVQGRIKKFKPDVLIATGAPFDLVHSLIGIQDTAGIKLKVADFRDPWIGGQAFGYSRLPEARLEFEKKKEAEVVSHYDVITMPWQKNIDELAQRHPGHADKLTVLSHFYDEDDVGSKSSVEKKTKFIYGGALYPGLEKVLANLSELCFQMKWRFELFTASDVNPEMLHDYFKAFKPIPSTEFFQRVKSAEYAILFLPQGNRFGLTKLFEIAACGIPIIAIGEESELSKEIEKNELGKFVEADNLLNKLPDIDRYFGTFDPNMKYVQEKSLSAVTNTLLDLINSKR